jgi:hypothetical protein
VHGVHEVEVARRDRHVRPAGRSPVEGGRAAVLALQRSAGNAAVAGLLRPPAVQRACGCGTCGGCGGQGGDQAGDRDDEAQVQREDEPATEPTTEPATAQATTTAAPRVEACAGSLATGAGEGGGILDTPPGGAPTGPVEGETDAPGETDLPGEGQPGETEDPGGPLAETAADASTCKVLTWSDFPESDKSGALTSYKFNLTGTTFTADFDATSSRRSKTVEKAHDGALDDCNSTDFENFAFQLEGTPEASCLATKQPGPAKATKKEECASTIKPLIDAANKVESARLLRHEQYHMKMGCALAAKGTAALAAGKAVTTATLTKKNNEQSTAYDAKAASDHSCNQSGQDTWEADIDAGLPKVTF